MGEQKKAKVSIVIPVYNGSNYMREAIDSALNQTYKNIEVIVVNDGSKDNSEEIALSYGDKIRYFSKQNGGVASALNVGIRHMTGEYFQYLPHDDIIASDKIEKQIQAILKSGDETSICWGGWSFLYTDGSKKKNQFLIEFNDLKKLQTDIYPMLFGQINTVSVLINKKLFDENGFFNEMLWTSQDYDMWFRTFRGRKTIYLADDLVHYRWHEEQGTQADSTFEANCKALSQKYVSEISDEQIENMFGTKYMFYYAMLYYYRLMGWKDCAHDIQECFKKTDEPNNGKTERLSLKETLKGTKGRLVLYGAGKNAKRLASLLREREIQPDMVCDNDKNKIGMELSGLRCVSSDEIDKQKDVILVTIDNPESLVEQLVQMGLEKVITFQEWGSAIFNTTPSKHRILLN